MNSGSPSTPSSPYTLASDRYKANVNRTKTRKWVEAKKIDYGGDDWGAEDDFEEDDADDSPNDRNQPIPQPQPSRTDRLAGLRAIGDGSGSSTPRSNSAGSARSLRPSERVAMERHGSGGVQQRNVTAPPALHVNTGVQAQRPVQPVVEPQESLSIAQQSPYPERKSSMSQQDRPDLTVDPAMQHPPRTSSRSASPGTRSPPGPVSPRIVRPADIYKRMEEEKEKERKSLDSTRRPSVDSFGSGDGADAANPQQRPSFGKKEPDGNRSLQPLASVAERKSEYGFDDLSINPGAPPPPPPKVSNETATETARDQDPGTRHNPVTSLASGPPTLQYARVPDDRPAVQPPTKRYSMSPKLPDFARLSGFGSDFFSGGGGFLGGSGSPKQPEAPAEATRAPLGVTTMEPTRHALDDETAAQTGGQSAALSNTQPPPEPSQPKPFRPSLPGTWVSETPSSIGEMATPLSEQGDKAANTRIPPIGEHPDDAYMKPAPLRTPTPRDRETFSRSTDDDRTSNKSGRSSPIKQPLRTTASPLSQSEKTPTQNKYTDSAFKPQQASDTTPIAPAPLQPRRSAGELTPQERFPAMPRTDTMLTDSSSPLKESDVLRDEIIRSLSPVRGSDPHLDAQGDAGATRESAYLSDVYGDYWAGGDKKPDDEHRGVSLTDALASVKEDAPASASGTRTPPAAGKMDPVKPNMKRERFSWEASSSPAKASPAKPAHPLPELPKSEPFDALELASPVALRPLSPPISLPVRSNDDGSEDTTLKDETAPEGLFISKTLSHSADDDTVKFSSPKDDNEAAAATTRDGGIFTPDSEEKIVDSPTTPTTQNPYLTSIDQPIRADSPTDIPLPRSPSPAKASGGDDAENTPPTSAGIQNAMNLKQIMALPTSPERVYKLHEARADFATMTSGLQEWLAQLAARPEHANAGPSFKYTSAGDDLVLFANSQRRQQQQHSAAAAVGGEGVSAPSGPGRRSSVTLVGGGGGGSVRIAAGAQAQLGNLMHGPAGAKGKELLQSAGKMGKGLLSKGKSKLRERTESKKA